MGLNGLFGDGGQVKTAPRLLILGSTSRIHGHLFGLLERLQDSRSPPQRTGGAGRCTAPLTRNGQHKVRHRVNEGVGNTEQIHTPQVCPSPPYRASVPPRPASGVALPTWPWYLAKTTDAGTGKKVFGSRRSRSQATLKPKSTHRVRNPWLVVHVPLRHLA